MYHNFGRSGSQSADKLQYLKHSAEQVGPPKVVWKKDRHVGSSVLVHEIHSNVSKVGTVMHYTKEAKVLIHSASLLTPYIPQAMYISGIWSHIAARISWMYGAKIAAYSSVAFAGLGTVLTAWSIIETGIALYDYVQTSIDASWQQPEPVQYNSYNVILEEYEKHSGYSDWIQESDWVAIEVHKSDEQL